MPLVDVGALLDVGIALSKEKDVGRLFETFLIAAMDITKCDAGMLYKLEDDILDFEILIVKSKGYRSSVGSLVAELPPVPLSSRHNICSCAAVEGKPLNVQDMYNCDKYDFSGGKYIDSEFGYQSISVLAVPMFDDQENVIGVIQLTNAQDENGGIIPFDEEYELVVFMLASQAAICLTNRKMMDERRRADDAEAYSMAKSRFLAQMSHEIRTPISAVMGVSEIQLQNPALSPEVEEAFVTIHNSAGILLGLVDDILDLSKIEAGRFSLIIDKYETSGLISDVAQLNLVYLGSKDVRLEIKVDENIPSHFIGDELRIKQILNNLLSNAIKYTEEGSVTFEIGSTAKGKDNVELNISIRDTGMGMSDEQLQFLLDEYSRFHDEQARHIKGTGLGMSITYNLLQLMEGEMLVSSEVGKGTAITLKIPQKTAGPDSIGAECARNLEGFKVSAEQAIEKLRFHREPMPYGKVLVVDDVDANLYVAQGLLGLYKLHTETVSGGHDAIKKIKEGKIYDIIFMDQMMPEMTGTEATRILRELGYAGTIVALTASALVGQAEKFLCDGFDGFLSKPIQTTHLNGILNKFIRDKQPQEVLEAAKAESGREDAAQAQESPIGETDGFDDYYSDPEIAALIREEFLETQQGVMEALEQALESRDSETSIRIVHTLKGLARMISEAELANLSEKAEETLEAGDIPKAELLDALSKELQTVFEHLMCSDEGK